MVALGTVTFNSGTIFAVDREGECQAGKAITFGVERVGDSQVVVHVGGWVGAGAYVAAKGLRWVSAKVKVGG